MLESPLAYHFCSSDSESRRDPLTIMRSWISQVISCNRDAFELACGRWETKDGRNASQTDIVELFKTIVQHTPNCTFVVDGLDECAWAEEKWKSNNDDSPIHFFESAKRAVAHTTTRILILSRDEPEIRYGLRAVLAGDSHQGLNEYQIRPYDVRSDAMLFSRSIVNKKLANKSETLKNELSQRMVDRCEGMFLWMKMLEEQLRSGKNKKQLEETIDQTPTALDHLYDRNWVKISHLPDKDKLRALSILRWAAFAFRPLTILEITEALLIVDDNCEDLSVNELPDAIDEDYVSSEILGLCGSLLETQNTAPKQDLSSMTIHLAHFSVKQYILCNMPAQGLLMVNERLRASSETFQSNTLAKLCLRYLNFRNVWQASLQLQSGPVKRPFRDYAAGSWYHHIRESGSNYEEVVKLTNALFSSNNENWESWKKWFDANDDKSKMPESQREITSTNPLFYASLLGLRDTVIYLLEEAKLCVNYVDGFNRAALQAAALKGQTLIVKLLLEKGADVTIANREGWTPLNSASANGHVNIVPLLLEKGADVAVADNEGWTPLKSASANGHVDVVQLLLKKGADVAVADNKGWTPLKSASANGHVDVVQLLLEKGADVAVASNEGWTPLNSASANGHIDIVQLLLEKGVDMAVASNAGWTPLNLASANGHVDIVQLLLEKGADVAVASNEGWTPLKSASANGHVDVVQLLLKKGANVAVASKEGWTPLNSASDNGHVDVIQLLLKKGADVAVASNEGWTPLNSASDSGHVDVVKLLLEKGADVAVASNEGWTPLNSASDSGHVDVVQLLLEKGADVTIANREGWTPLNSASNNGHVDVVKLLLDNTVMKQLLEKGAELETKSNSGRTPLSCAAEKGHEAVLKLLLEKGAELESKDNDGRTPLSWAAEKGHEAVVKLLLEKGAELESKDYINRTPLLLAAENGHEAVVRLLLTKDGINQNIEGEDDRTMLSQAVVNGLKLVI
jgi:ankyrin repeat protein